MPKPGVGSRYSDDERIMRIALFLPFLNLGGTQRVVSIMANTWAAKGWEVTILSLDEQGQQPFYPLDERVRWTCLGNEKEAGNALRGFWSNLKRILRLRTALKQLRPHILVSFLISANVLAVVASLGLGIPVVVSERSDPHKQVVRRTWSVMRRLTYPLARHLVVLSEHYLPFYVPIMGQRISAIANPALVPPARSEVGINLPADRVVLSVGRLSPEKGFDLLIQAFSRLCQHFPQWHLLILGEGDLRSALQRQAAELGIADRVHLPGRVTNVYDYMSQADLYVLSSRLEGFGIVLCEAMACGMPVVAFEASVQTAEIVRDGVDGILVPAENVVLLEKGMAQMMADEALRRRCGENARSVTQRFSMELIQSQWEQVIQAYVRPESYE